MTNTGGRKPDEGERYRAILETAARLICDRGYEGTSMQEIAAACRMTKAGLYHHIQNKEQLLFAIMNYGMDLFEEQVLSRVQDIANPVERLRACMRHNILLVTRGWSKEVIIILHEHATLTGETRAFIDARKKKYVDFLEEAFSQASQQGLIRPVDPTVGAFSFLGMVLWIYKWFKPDGRLTDEQIADGMVGMLFPPFAAAGDTAGQAGPSPLRMVPNVSATGTDSEGA
ncbi:TetR/AcrR family transcriptional regulator [Myxococcus sp. AB056]|uniref:TetR/AcrR family transcriptional regulator n=1 Tax=Myxococcus sp. AB056 TaxID=2562792 RepID=UPI0011472537|nr:TetR/AcrR family transcriptional regulator [Myxococcus sp. AB056]